MVKMSSFLIGLILFSLTASVFGFFYADLNESYPRTDYDNSSLESFNKLSELTSLVNETKTETNNIVVETSLTDIIGGYFRAAYNALRVSVAGVDTFTTMADEAAEQSGISHIGLVKTALVAIVFILIFLGIFISAMVKSNV